MTNNNFPSSASLKNLSDLNPRVRNHLVRVYTTLGSMMATSAAGSYAQIFGYLFFNPFLCFLLSITCLLALVFLRPSQDNNSLRFAILFLFAFSNGLSSAPLIASTLAFYPGVLTVTLTSTALSFLSFSLGALLSARRSFIFLGGILGTALSSLSILSLFNGLMRNSGVDTLLLFAGLLMFSGYVIYDTQIIVERASREASDVVSDSLTLFGDLIGIFYRIMIILRRQQDDEDRRRNRRRY